MNDNFDFDGYFNRLSKSKFRASFKLKDNDIKYIDDKGMDIITSHAYDFVNKRLRPKIIVNDGKQTPFKGHPVFIAQHATACCCRDCISKWLKLSKDRELTNEEVDLIVSILIKWINTQYNEKKSN